METNLALKKKSWFYYWIMRLRSKDLQVFRLTHVQMILHTLILFPWPTLECNSQVYSHHGILHWVSGWSHTAGVDVHGVASGYFSICKVTICDNFILYNKFSMVVVFHVSTRRGPSYVARRVPSITACFSLMDSWHILISCLTVTLTRKGCSNRFIHSTSAELSK